MSRARLLTAAATLALSCATLLLGHEGVVAAKGRVAAALIEAAWRARLRDGRPHRPWPWADFTPVGRIEVPRLGIDRPILSDASGRTLAFGLGLAGGGAEPGGPGLVAVAGHRSSWGGFLRDLRDGDDLLLTGPRGIRRYTVVEREVVDRDALDGNVGGSMLAGGEDGVVLITCWPLDGLWRGPRRYLVIGRPRPGRGGGGLDAGQF